MKKYVRITNGKVDNIYETNNDIAQEFPEGGLWVEVDPELNINYELDAVNNDGVWTFTGGPFPSPIGMEAGVGKQVRIDRAYGRMSNTALLYKIEAGVATPADEAFLVANKQYIIALSEVNKQPGFPATINWPVAP